VFCLPEQVMVAGPDARQAQHPQPVARHDMAGAKLAAKAGTVMHGAADSAQRIPGQFPFTKY
jgi:hypothetical protein